MSKAFTREDDQPEADPPKPRSPLPPGAKNYMTSDGAKRLQDELDARPGAARIEEIHRILESAVIVEPPTEGVDIVRFGATVRVRSLSDGQEMRYRIVGVDETDIARGFISWVSPVAKALLTHSAGDEVRVELPSGTKRLEILEVGFATGRGAS